MKHIRMSIMEFIENNYNSEEVIINEGFLMNLVQNGNRDEQELANIMMDEQNGNYQFTEDDRMRMRIKQSLYLQARYN